MTRDDLSTIRGLLADMDGVWFVGNTPIPGAIDALTRLRARRVPVRFITNTTTRTRSQLAERMRAMGFDLSDDEFVTTPEAARRYLTARGIRTVRLVVSDPVRAVFDGFVESPHPEAIVIGDVGKAWTYDLMNDLFRAVVDGAEIVALQRGRYWQVEDGLRLDIGAFVTGLEYATGRQATLIGKPAPALFETALADLGMPAGDVVMIGDDVHNDVAGAQAAGIRGVLVKTGKYREDLVALSGVTPDLVIESIADV
jgi:HAD superfamily hydrolase (TIGR01458 family)